MSGKDFQGETEQSLVEALRQGRQEMLGELYDAYAPVMMGMITRIVPNADIAEEVLKETFIAIWHRIGIYDSSKDRLLTWGLAIARGLALEAVKSCRYTAAVNQAKKPAENGSPKNEDLLNGQIKIQDLCTLAPLEKMVLNLLYLEGRTCVEAAGELNMTEEEIKVVLKKAFSQLKAEKKA